MKRVNFFTIDKSSLFAIINHHYDILHRACRLRVLEDYEYNFLTLLTLYNLGAISLDGLRQGCIDYFNH